MYNTNIKGGIGDQNKREYGARRVVSYFRRRKTLQLPEHAALRMIAGEFTGKRILDIGVGGGRTTPHLLEISQRYIGIDYSAEMIRACRADYPGIDFRIADARDLSDFEDATVDLVLFSFNGIDAVGHSDRLRILAEIHRILVTRGVFLFSSHNRSAEIVPPWSFANLGVGSNPLKMPLRLFRYGLGIYNHFHKRRHEETGPDYRIINNEQRYYSMLIYHMFIADQLRQLCVSGFSETIALNREGRVLGIDGDDDRSPWIYYLTRKQP